MNRNMKPVLNPFACRILAIRLEVREMQSAKFYAILLVSVMLAGIFSLSPAISTLMNDVIITSTGRISATNVTASSGSPDDIQAAVDVVEAAGGGNVYIPEGNFSFVIDPAKIGPTNRPTGVNIRGGVSIIGGGIDKTILYQPSDPPLGGSMFAVDGRNNKKIRISGITFKGCVTSEDASGGGITIVAGKDYRVDHCKFIDFAGQGIFATNHMAPYGANRGVIDHCNFDNPYKDIIGGLWGYGITVIGTYYNWEDINNLLGRYDGLSNIVYIEDCNFSRTRHAVSSTGGGYYVVRHCTLSEPRPKNFGMIDIHGVSGYEGVGGRGLEAYDNLIIGAADYAASQVFWLRGGGGVIFNNTIQGCAYGVMLTEEAGQQEKCKVHDLWIWNNAQDGGTFLTPGDYTENVDYFLYQKAGYVLYPYPHPLTFEAAP